jgi:hypothetical protein
MLNKIPIKIFTAYFSEMDANLLMTDLILLMNCGIFSSNLTIKFERKLGAKTA